MNTLAAPADVRLERSLQMTLALLLLYSPDEPYIRVPLSVLALLGLFFPRAARTPWVWLAGTTLVAMACLLRWYSIDNHKVLLAYWCCALFVANQLVAPAEALAVCARRTLGLVFAAASFAKLAASDFLDGSFFTFTLLTDSRFALLARTAGATGDVQTANAAALKALHAYDSTLHQVIIEAPEGVRALATGMTAWTILIELAVSVAFLWPGSSGPARIRDGLLLVFVATTYLFAPVTGFGWVLLCIGIAQTEPAARWLQVAYVILFLIAQGYHYPWASVFLTAS